MMISRFSVAKFLEKTFFDEKSWDKMKVFLKKEELNAETNKRHVYFPCDALVIDNPAGTANYDMLEKNDKKYFILPGPPREIKSFGNLF